MPLYALSSDYAQYIIKFIHDTARYDQFLHLH